MGRTFRLSIATIVFKRKSFQQFSKDPPIRPIFKKGDVSVLTNYLPISVIPTFAYIFERLLLNQFVKYLEKFALLNKNKFGFQSGESSTDAVLYFIEKIIGNMEDNDTGTVFLDLAKAFNSISHEIFLKKAKNFNLYQSTINFSNLFSNIKHDAQNWVLTYQIK